MPAGTLKKFKGLDVPSGHEVKVSDRMGLPRNTHVRGLIGVALFASAYMAEVVRGGLQAIPKGQYEGADSLGLGYWQKMVLIVLPQD